MKVIIAGGRKFNDYDLLKKSCDNALSLQKIVEVVSGVADGADKLGERYARESGHQIKRFPAKWYNANGVYDKSAGYKRNKEMAQYADALIAFWNGSSNGTRHMIDLAHSYGLKVKVIPYK